MAENPKVTEKASDDATDAAEPGEPSGKAGGWRARFRLGRRRLLLAAVPALLLMGGGYYGATAFGISVPVPAKKRSARSAVYYDLPEMVVNLSSGDKRVQYLKLKVALEAGDQKVIDALTPVMPRILDMFQLYLRELRSTDLEGSAGIFRLKEELLRRINTEIHPQQVNRVLFKEIIVQ